MAVSLDLEALGRDVVSTLQPALEDKLCGVVLFGSLARGEAGEWSDIDLFVLLRDIPWDRDRKTAVYLALDDIRRKYHRDTTVIERDLSEIKDVDRMLIDVAADGIILYDRGGLTAGLLAKVRAAVDKAGLVRYQAKDGKYGWKLTRKLSPGERFGVTLEGI